MLTLLLSPFAVHGKPTTMPSQALAARLAQFHSPVAHQAYDLPFLRARACVCVCMCACTVTPCSNVKQGG